MIWCSFHDQYEAATRGSSNGGERSRTSNARASPGAERSVPGREQAPADPRHALGPQTVEPADVQPRVAQERRRARRGAASVAPGRSTQSAVTLPCSPVEMCPRSHSDTFSPSALKSHSPSCRPKARCRCFLGTRWAIRCAVFAYHNGVRPPHSLLRWMQVARLTQPGKSVRNRSSPAISPRRGNQTWLYADDNELQTAAKVICTVPHHGCWIARLKYRLVVQAEADGEQADPDERAGRPMGVAARVERSF